eukprot:3628272-Rhodomonas_salina.1
MGTGAQSSKAGGGPASAATSGKSDAPMQSGGGRSGGGEVREHRSYAPPRTRAYRQPEKVLGGRGGEGGTYEEEGEEVGEK